MQPDDAQPIPSDACNRHAELGRVVPSTAGLLWGPVAAWLAGQILLAISVAAGASLDFAATICLCGIVVLSAHLLGQFPLFFIGKERPDHLTGIVFVSMALRSSLAILACVALLAVYSTRTQAIGLSFVGWYGLLLVADLAVTARFLKRLYPDTSFFPDASRGGSEAGSPALAHSLAHSGTQTPRGIL